MRAAKTLAIVGESGCGKSVTVQSIMGLIPMPPGRITRGTAVLDGVDIIRQKIVSGHGRARQSHRDDLSGPDELAESDDDASAIRSPRRSRCTAATRSDKALERAVELLALSHIPEAG